MTMEVRSSLTQFCRSGEVENVRYILSYCSLSKYPEWSEGYFLLCEALKNKELEIVKLLLQNEAKVNFNRNENSNSDTPLHYAVRIGNVEVIEILLDKNADINAVNKNKKTPLHLAINDRNEEIVKLLLKKGADVEINDKHGCTSLHLAVKKGDEKIVQHLINHKADVNFGYNNHTALYFAVKCNNIDIVKLLIQSGAIVHSNYAAYFDLLQLSIYQNSTKIVQLLLENGQKVNKADCEVSTLHCKSEEESSKREIVKILLDNNCSTSASVKFDNKSQNNIFDRKNEEIIDLLGHSTKNYVEDNELVKLDTDLIDEIQEDESVFEFVIPEQEKSIMPGDSSDVQLDFPLPRISDTNEAKNISVFNAVSKNFNSLLHTALIMKLKDIVKILLEQGFDANAKNEFGRTSMYYAYKYNNLDMCKYLLEKGVLINSKINNNLNILHMAVENNDENFVKFLLEEGAEINAITNENYTSLHIACKKGYERIVKLLLKHNINIHTKGKNGLTSLHEAVKQGTERIVKLLLRKGSLVDDSADCLSTPLHFAVQNNRERVVSHLLKYDANVNTKDSNCKTPLCYAVEAGNMIIVRLLLNRNLNIHDESNKLSVCLSILGNVPELSNIVEIFLLRGFTINFKDFNDFLIPEPLYSKYMSNYAKVEYLNIFEDLLKCKPSVNAFFQYQVLRNSVEKGFKQIVQFLLRHDANLNILLEENCTLLHIAIKNGQFWIAEELLNRGANVNAIDVCGRTPLHISILNNFTDLSTFLLKHKADIEARDEDGKTALHLASDGRRYITKLFLDAGADINSVSANKSTSLHIASQGGHTKIVKLLLDYDATINMKNRSEETALDLAIYWQRKEVVAILLEHGAMYSMFSVSFLSRSICETIMIHLIKVHTINADNDLNFEKKYNDFRLKCSDEVEKMVSHHIGAKVLLYDILAREDCIVEMYMRNVNILRILDSSYLEELYPIYINMLKVRMNKAKRRNLLVDLGGESLELIFKMKIPYLIIQKLFSYVSNVDLRNLILATSTD